MEIRSKSVRQHHARTGEVFRGALWVDFPRLEKAVHYSSAENRDFYRIGSDGVLDGFCRYFF
jgi:hypothetical protein